MADLVRYWIMKAKDVAGLTPKEIQNKYALPFKPEYICDVKLDTGLDNSRQP